MREKTCCFTGHRKIPSEQYNRIAERLKAAIIGLIHQGVIYFGVGGALGFDTMAAQAVLTLKESYPQIKLILVLPCKTQTHGWKKADIEIYKKIKAECDKCVYVSNTYTADCMHKRNRRLVKYSRYCICYQTKSTGGTAYTVEYAKRNGLTVINLA